MMIVCAAMVQADGTPLKITQGVVVSEARVRVPVPGQNLTAAYFHLHNQSDQERLLVAATSPIAARGELHNHTEAGGMKIGRAACRERVWRRGGHVTGVQTGALPLWRTARLLKYPKVWL